MAIEIDEVRKSLLDDVFQAPDKYIQTFRDAIEELIEDPNSDDEDTQKVVLARPDPYAMPELTEQRAGFIGITHGWHDQDYVWHISPFHPKRPFKVPLDRAVYGIAKTMNDIVPAKCEVKIWYPYAEWEIQELTFKAIGLREFWTITEAAITELNLKLFTLLNALV